MTTPGVRACAIAVLPLLASIGCANEPASRAASVVPLADPERASEDAISADIPRPPPPAGAEANAAPAAPAARASTGVSASVSPEMAAFLKDLDGSDDGVKKALAKVAAPRLDDQEMSMYCLHSAKVIHAGGKSQKQTCYDFEANAGMMVYTFGVCWQGRKIVSVERKRSYTAGTQDP